MSGYTSLLRLVLQTFGENLNTWGDVINNGAIALIEKAIAGVTVVATTGGSTTLSTANGADDQSRAAALQVTGALVSNAIIVVPTLTKIYVVANDTSGNFTVAVQTVGGTGVTVDQGKTAFIWCDGTNVRSVQMNTGTTGVAGIFRKATSGDVTTGTATDCAVTPDAIAPTLTSLQSQITAATPFLVQSGSIVPFAGLSLPAGYLACNGAAVSRTTYAALFSAIGVTWGVGDGATTFNVPNLARRTLVGSGGTGAFVLGNAVGNVGGEELHTLGVSEIPPLTVSFGTVSRVQQGPDNGESYAAKTVGGTTGGSTVLSLNTNGGSAGHNTIQPSAVCLYCIKY